MMMLLLLQGLQQFLPLSSPRLGPPGQPGHRRPADSAARSERLQRAGAEGREGGVREQRHPGDHESLHQQSGRVITEQSDFLWQK